MFKKPFQPSVAAIAAAITVLPGSVLAQGAGKLEEVVVTAQKRAENLQDVGIAVTALSGEEMARAGIDDLSRVELVTAGVTFGIMGSDAKINIRGANADNTFSDAYPIAGLFIDGVYRARAAQHSQPFFDVDRIEVLKGPQGTLYGRSTFMGAINVNNRRPEFDEFNGYVKGGVARFGKITSEGAVNVPLSDTLAVRAAMHTSNSDGWIENDGPGGDLGQDDSINFRASARWLPSDSFEAFLTFTSISEEGTTPGIFAAEGLCRPVNSNGFPDVFGQDVNCDNVVPNAPTNFREPNNVAYDVPSFRDNSEQNVTFDVSWNATDSLTIRSISSWTDFESLTDHDADFSDTLGDVYFWDELNESITSELQFIYDNGGSVTGQAGAYYSVDDMAYGFSQLVQLNGLSSYADWQEIETTTQAVFAQVEFAISDSLRLTTGLRYNDEEKDVDSFVANNFAGHLDDDGNVVPGVNLGTLGRASIDGRPISDGIYNFMPWPSATKVVSWDKLTWRVAGEYDFNDDVMGYASVSTGFLSGGVLLFGDDIDQQTSKAFELGLKSRWADDAVQLNLALYRNELTNLTTEAAVEVGGAFVTLQQNSGDSTTHGLEAELVWLPSDNWYISSNISIIDAEYGDFIVKNNLGQVNGVDAQNVDQSGTTPPFAPDVTLSAIVSYDWMLEGGSRVTPRLQFYYSAEYATDNETLYSTQMQDAYTKTDFSLTWASADDNITAAVFVENMEDSEVLARTNIGGAAQVQGGYLYPRNYGVRASYNF